MKKTNLWKQITGLVFALAMIIAAFVVVSPEAVNAAEYTMAGSGTQSVTITDAECFEFTGQEAWIQFKPKQTGYVTVKATNVSELYNDTYGGITLCNKSKKIISETDEGYFTEYTDASHYTMTYGVKKNTTYYLRVKAMGGTKVTATFKSVKKNAATKKSKAKTIKKGKNVKGVIIAGDKKADWYKIKLTKSQQVKLSYSVKGNGYSSSNGVKVTFCKSNGKNFVSNSYDVLSRSYPNGKRGGMTFYREYVFSGKKTGLATGTYYVKVEPYTNTSSGYYTLKWK